MVESENSSGSKSDSEGYHSEGYYGEENNGLLDFDTGFDSTSDTNSDEQFGNLHYFSYSLFLYSSICLCHCESVRLFLYFEVILRLGF